MGLQREWGAPTVEAQATLTSTGHPCMWPIGSRALMIVTGFNNHLYSTMKCQGHASVQQDKSNANGARFKVAFLFDTVCEAQQCFRWLQVCSAQTTAVSRWWRDYRHRTPTWWIEKTCQTKMKETRCLGYFSNTNRHPEFSEQYDTDFSMHVVRM